MKAVLWDLDGTLVDSEPAHAAAFEAALRELGLRVPTGFHDGLLGASEDRVHAALVAQTGTVIDRAGWRALKARHYRAAAGRIVRLPAADLIPPLARAGIAQAVVSNSTRAEVDHNLAVTGLAGSLSVTISRDDVGLGKPDPEGYLAAARRLGTDAAECLVVEDSPTGAAAGLAAGMTTIFHSGITGLAVPDGALVPGPEGLAGLFGRLGLIAPGPGRTTDPDRRHPCSPHA